MLLKTTMMLVAMAMFVSMVIFDTCAGVSMVMFVIYFSVGLAPIPFVIAAEIFPQHLRDIFTSISVSTFYIMTAIVTLIFGELYPIIGVSIKIQVMDYTMLVFVSVSRPFIGLCLFL